MGIDRSGHGSSGLVVLLVLAGVVATGPAVLGRAAADGSDRVIAVGADGVHPHDGGHAHLADLIEPAVRSALDDAPSSARQASAPSSADGGTAFGDGRRPGGRTWPT